MTAERPLHRTVRSEQGPVNPFPKPGTTWRPLHRKPHQSNKRISIRRVIASGGKEDKS